MSQESVVKEVLGWSDDDLSQMAKALGLSDDKRDVIDMNFSTAEWSNNAKIREAIAYIGFDPKKIADQFFKKAEEGKRSADDKLLTYGQIQLYEKNDDKTDLMFFLNTFLERGNNLPKALVGCDEVMGPVLKRKANAYGITTEGTQNKNILGTRHLTLARLAQAFAQCTAALILKDNIKSKLNSKLIPGMPILMYHSVMPALIPNDDSEIANTLRAIVYRL